MHQMKKIVNKPVAAMTCVCLLAVVVMAIALMLSKPRPSQFLAPSFDPNAVGGVPAVPEHLGWSELDADAFHVGVCGKVAITNSTADVWLTNLEMNAVWLKLRILDTEGNILGETGLLKPGQYVQAVALNTVPPSGAKITLKVMAYEPETYHSAGSISINTSIY